jgi:hypothetical protein
MSAKSVEELDDDDDDESWLKDRSFFNSCSALSSFVSMPLTKVSIESADSRASIIVRSSSLISSSIVSISCGSCFSIGASKYS